MIHRLRRRVLRRAEGQVPGLELPQGHLFVQDEAVAVPNVVGVELLAGPLHLLGPGNLGQDL